MRSNARGSADHPGMEPTVLINTSFISQIDGQSAKVEASASTASGANVAKFVQDHRALILNFFRLEFQDSEYVGLFRRAVGLPWYTTITLTLLTLLMATGATLLACVQYQVAAAKQGLDALHAAEPYPPDFSDQVIAVHVDHQYITPGLNARVCRCSQWPFDPRIRYHAVEFAALEQNAYSLLYSRLDRSAIRSISIYMEEATVNGAGIGYCSRVGAHKNHACPGLPDGVSSLELLWQWSTASGWPHATSARLLPFAGLPMDGSQAGQLMIAVHYEPTLFPGPISSSPFAFWDQSGVSIRLSAQLRQQALSTITLANMAFTTNNLNTTASHCFAISLRGESSTSDQLPMNSTLEALRQQGLVSVQSWAMGTRGAGTSVRMSAWRPLPLSGGHSRGVDLAKAGWRSEYVSQQHQLNLSNETDPATALHRSWQLLWSANDSNYDGSQPHTHQFTDLKNSAMLCGCYVDAEYDEVAGGCVRQNNPTEVLLHCGSILQDRDVICTSCTYAFNSSVVRHNGLGPQDELCMGYLTVLPAESVAQSRYVHSQNCSIGQYNANVTACGCDDANECASAPCEHPEHSCVESTSVNLTEGRFARIGPAYEGSACRFLGPVDNPEYYQVITVGAFDRNACETECEQDVTGDVCRGFEYHSRTGRCELWHVSPSTWTAADGYQCYIRVGTSGTYACV